MDKTTPAHQDFFWYYRERCQNPGLDSCLGLCARRHHKKRLNIKASLYSILQILSLTIFETTPINQLLSGCDKNMINAKSDNQ